MKYYTTSESYQIDSQIAGDLIDINPMNSEQYYNNKGNNNRKIGNLNI